MKLADQFRAIADGLPENWDDLRLEIVPEQPNELERVAQVLGPMGVGRLGGTLVVHVRRAGGASSPSAAKRLFSMLDKNRVWCTLGAGAVVETAAVELVADEGQSPTATWDHAIESLPSDWSDLLCELQIASSALLPRAALLCAPINPTRVPNRLVFTFRCARQAGYGVSPQMARRCFERLEADGIHGNARVLRVLSGTDRVGTQGPVWVVGGKML